MESMRLEIKLMDKLRRPNLPRKATSLMMKTKMRLAKSQRKQRLNKIQMLRTHMML